MVNGDDSDERTPITGRTGLLRSTERTLAELEQSQRVILAHLRNMRDDMVAVRLIFAVIASLMLAHVVFEFIYVMRH